jgi:glycosyltransferase involved in cell wall biosynthesis
VIEPSVSVVIPAYNAARTLAASVDSALQQTRPVLEVIIVDDGSSDETLAAARSLECERVRVLSQENGGAASARNTGIRAAKGEFVAFLDADDLWLPEKIERQMAYLARYPSSDAVQCGSFFVDDELRVLYVKECTDTGDSFREALLFQNLPAFLSALVVRRTSLMETGAFDTDLEILEEWDMALKMARRCGMRSVPEPLVKYRVHPGNRHRNVGIHIAPGLLILKRLFADAELPEDIRRMRRRVYGTFYRTLAGGYYNAGSYRRFVVWALRALIQDPLQVFYMAGLPLRAIRRRRSARI